MTLQFAPFASQISSSFWSSLARIKVDRLQLSQESINVQAYYSPGRSVLDRTTGEIVPLPVGLHFSGEALAKEDDSQQQERSSPTIELNGYLKNFNTIEEFRNADKGALLSELGEELLEMMRNGVQPLRRLQAFSLVTFADLKKFKFIYWLACPALLTIPAWQVSGEWKDIGTVFSPVQIESMAEEVSRLSRSEAGFFLVHPSGRFGSVMQYDSFLGEVAEGERMLGFIDPSPHRTMPGWPLRNVLTLLSIRFSVKQIRVLCWKSKSDDGTERSVIVKLEIPRDNVSKNVIHLTDGKALPVSCQEKDTSKPVTVGWERNSSGKLAPKLADLGPLMDPARLADQAVDLNLKLMRWRILPDIDLDKIKSTRCLLLGAGTLGCYVARTLLGWGVRKITFVDSSTVSFSNPVRQPLFEYQDSVGGGKPKSQCAAESLKRIYPGVESTGFQISIPMPGHPIPEASVKQSIEDIALLEELMADHDVIFLLMDSRESRWLPTVMGAVKGKLVMNTALGFDTFLAMRHGANPDQQRQEKESSSSSLSRLGCYFCNDIVAPTDSLTDRTLDQMCTVTRPGIAAIASAMTVELMVSVLQHPKGILAGAFSNAQPEASILGHLPHQLRGSLFNFTTLLIHGPAYDKCTGCSATVLEEYKRKGFEMIQKACNDDTYLRTLTGLDKLYDATDDIEVEWSDDEDEDGAGEEGDGELL